MSLAMVGLSWASALVVGGLALCVGVFALQVFSAVLPCRSRAPSKAVEGPADETWAVLIPAHDEARGLAATLASVQAQRGPSDRILVVADNCADDTAAVARARGVEVVERRHATARGKGFALACGIEHLRAAPPAAVLLLDADCELAPGAVPAMKRALRRSQRPVQALYLMQAPDDAPLAWRLARFAWRVRNQVRPLGGARLGQPCQLMGTGMAFTWPMLRDALLAHASLVEDMKLGIDLACRGWPPVFCPAACVTSRFPQGDTALRTQRTRWQHGHLELIGTQVPRLVRTAWRRRDARLLALAADLLVPPLALLAALVGVAALVAVGAVFAGASTRWGWVLCACAALFGVSILVAWAGFGRDLLAPRELWRLPRHVIARLPIYLGFLVRRQREWVRTDRD